MNVIVKVITFKVCLLFYCLGLYISLSHHRISGSLTNTFGENRFKYVNYVSINYQLFTVAALCGLKIALVRLLSKIFTKCDTTLHLLSEVLIRAAILAMLDLRLKQVTETDFHSRVSIHLGDCVAILVTALVSRWLEEGGNAVRLASMRRDIEQLQREWEVQRVISRSS